MALYDNNKATIIMELINSLCKIARKYENRLIVGGYKTFDHNELLRNLDQKLIKSNMDTMMDNNVIYLDQFIKVLDQHAPLETKKLRKNQVKFMTTELGKAFKNI